MDESIQPDVSPPDENGFRTFSLYAPIGEAIIMVSFHLDRQREWLANTSSEENQYTKEERERLALAARIVAAHDGFDGHNPDDALAKFFEVSPNLITQSLEQYFPSLTVLAVQVASDVCVKHAMNLAVQSTGAPRLYDAAVLQQIMSEFVDAATKLLGISSGRPLETEQHLRETTQALEKLEEKGEVQRGGEKLPKQELVAAKVGVSDRSLRAWCDGCGLEWHEFLRACGWPVDRKEIEDE